MVLSDAIRRNVPAATFRSKLGQIGVDAAAMDLVADALYKRKEGIVAAVKARQAAFVGSSGALLTDFDWSVNHVLASDKLASVGETLLSLRLQVSNADGSTGIVSTELSAPEVDALITHLEAAQAAAQRVQGRI